MTATATRAGAYVIPAGVVASALDDVAVAVENAGVARHVLVEPCREQIRLTASGSLCRVCVLVDAEDLAEERMLLPFERFRAIAKTIPSEQAVKIAANGAVATVKTAGGSWKLYTESAAELREWHDVGMKPLGRIPADQFRRAIKSVLPACDAPVGGVLGGVLVDVQGGMMTFVASDGRRMALAECAVEQAVDDSQTILPAEPLKAAMRLADGNTGEVQFLASPKCAAMDFAAGSITTSVLSGNFPAWRRVLPDRSGVAQTAVSRAELIHAIKAVRVCADDTSIGVRIEFGSEVLKLSSRSATHGEAKVSCPVLEAGHAVTVLLDPGYVLDWLATFDKESDPTVTIEADHPGSAVVFRCDDATNVVMPLNPD